jgi:hypothetical protein
VKEATYHLRHSSEWMIRFGDGTEESHQRAQAALDDLWTYTGDLFEDDAVLEAMVKAGIAPDIASIKEAWSKTVDQVLSRSHTEAPRRWLHGHRRPPRPAQRAHGFHPGRDAACDAGLSGGGVVVDAFRSVNLDRIATVPSTHWVDLPQ